MKTFESAVLAPFALSFPRKQIFQATNFISSNGPVIIAYAPKIVRMRFPEYFAYIRTQKALWYFNSNVLRIFGFHLDREKKSDQEEREEVVRCARSLRRVEAIIPPRHH